MLQAALAFDAARRPGFVISQTVQNRIAADTSPYDIRNALRYNASGLFERGINPGGGGAIVTWNPITGDWLTPLDGDEADKYEVRVDTVSLGGGITTFGDALATFHALTATRVFEGRKTTAGSTDWVFDAEVREILVPANTTGLVRHTLTLEGIV